MMDEFKNKVAVVTGSGRGIGRAIAKLFAEEGAAVVVNDIDKAPLDEIVREIQASRGKAAGCVADITKAEIEAKLTGELTSHSHASSGGLTQQQIMRMI